MFTILALVITIVLLWILLFVCWAAITLSQKGYGWRYTDDTGWIRTDWGKTLWRQTVHFTKPDVGPLGPTWIHWSWKGKQGIRNPFLYLILAVVLTGILTAVQTSL